MEAKPVNHVLGKSLVRTGPVFGGALFVRRPAGMCEVVRSASKRTRNHDGSFDAP